MGRRNRALVARASHFTWRGLRRFCLPRFLLISCLFTVATLLEESVQAVSNTPTHADQGEEEPGALFGPGYSRLCSGPLDTSDTARFPAAPRPDSKPSVSLQAQQPTVPSFTFCAFVRVHKSRPRSPLLTYFGRTWTVTADLTRMGVEVEVKEERQDKLLQYFFEAKFPPQVWRHICLQFDRHTLKVLCFVDDSPELLSSRTLLWTTTSGENYESTIISESNDIAVKETTLPAWKPENSHNKTSNTTGSVDRQTQQEPLRETLCVGGFDRGTLEADLARPAFWRMSLKEEHLQKASRCHGSDTLHTPGQKINLKLKAYGNVSLQVYKTEEVCASWSHTPVIQPAGTYSRHVIVCEVLGGSLLTSQDLTPAMKSLARGTNDSCVGPGGLMTWVFGGLMTRRMKVTAEDECPAQGTEEEMMAACVRQLNCSLCQVPSTVLYTLYGHDGRLFDHSYYIETNLGEMTFQGLGGSAILRLGPDWILQSTLHETEWVLREAAIPVGRQQWLTGDQEVSLVLTHCRTSQFTCDDGQCVSQLLRCDDIVHCRDHSDEANCAVIERLSGYDPYYPPPPRPGEVIPISLNYHVDVYSMDDMTTEGGQATMNVGMTLTWFDPRIKFLNLKPKVKNYFPCDLVWTPSVRAVSGHGEGTVLETRNYEKFCFAYDHEKTKTRPLSDPFMSHQIDGMSHAIVNYVGVVASTPCHFELQRYPFDFQLCNISFMLMNAPWTRVFTKTTEGSQVPYLDSRRVLLEYVLEDQTTEVGSFLQGTDNNTYFALIFHLRRLYGYHVLNSFFPSLLMFFISYATYFFQLEDFTNRIMISLTAQLVLAALFTSTTQSSVRTPYLKLIDVWYAAVITFCFFIIISQTVINVLLNSPINTIPDTILRAVRLNHKRLKQAVPFPSVTVQDKEEEEKYEQPSSGNPALAREVALRYNSVFRVVILVVVVSFVSLYSTMALGVL